MKLRSRPLTQTSRSRSLPRRGLAVASLKPRRLRGRASGGSPGRRSIAPRWLQRSRAAGWAQRSSSRSARSAAAASVAQTCRQRSPSLVAGSSTSPANAGSGASATGRRGARPRRASKTPGPQSQRDRQRRSGAPSAPTGVSAHETLRGGGEIAHEDAQRVTTVRLEVQRGEGEVVEHRSGDPRLVEGVDRGHHVVGPVGRTGFAFADRHASRPSPCPGPLGGHRPISLSPRTATVQGLPAGAVGRARPQAPRASRSVNDGASIHQPSRRSRPIGCSP